MSNYLEKTNKLMTILKRHRSFLSSPVSRHFCLPPPAKDDGLSWGKQTANFINGVGDDICRLLFPTRPLPLHPLK